MHYIKLSKVKHEEFWKQQEKNNLSCTREPSKLPVEFFQQTENLAGQKGVGWHIRSAGEKKKKTADILEGKMVKREKPASLDPHKDQ